MFHDGFAAGPRDADDVEARVALLQSLLGQEKLRRLNHFSLLSKFHRFERRAEAATGSRLHFDEHDHAPIQHDKIQLSRLAAIIPLNQFVALFLEIALGHALAFFA